VVRAERVVLVVWHFGGGYICRISKHLLWLVLDFNSGADSRSGGVDAIKFVKIFMWSIVVGVRSDASLNFFVAGTPTGTFASRPVSNVGDITERSKRVSMR
jgi:hypothetical protein